MVHRPSPRPLAATRIGVLLALSLSAAQATDQPLVPGAAELEALAARHENPIAIDDFEDASCPDIPPNGLPSIDNPRLYTMTEIGGCEKLSCFLKKVPHTIHSNATLIIDNVCALTETIRIPSRFTLAGVGMAGEGSLTFSKLPAGASAIVVDQEVGGNGGNSEISIRDLSIYWGPIEAPDSVVGLNVTGGNIVRVENVRISGFTLGVFGRDAYSVWIEQSNISGNRLNVALGQDANGWRIRDNVLSQADSWSLYVPGPANDLVLAGNRLEGSGLGGVLLDQSAGSVIRDNRFESNPPGPGASYGVWMTSAATSTRVLANIFSSDVIANQSLSSYCAGNAPLGAVSCYP